MLTAEAAGFFVAPGAPGPFPAAFPAGNALADASSASIISCNAERGDCIVEGCRPRRARRDGEGVVGHVTGSSCVHELYGVGRWCTGAAGVQDRAPQQPRCTGIYRCMKRGGNVASGALAHLDDTHTHGESGCEHRARGSCPHAAWACARCTPIYSRRSTLPTRTLRFAPA